MLMSDESLGSDWQRASWPIGPWRALTTTRTGGVSKGVYEGLNLAAHVGDARQAVARNRRLVSARVGKRRIQWLDQPGIA
jgi:copper oxidase (laccase) domain-containing protein